MSQKKKRIEQLQFLIPTIICNNIRFLLAIWVDRTEGHVCTVFKNSLFIEI